MKTKEKKSSQTALLNFIVTCRTASEGILDVYFDHLEYGPKELSHTTLNAFGNTFLSKTNFKASFINLEKIRNTKELNLRAIIQNNFKNVYDLLSSIVKGPDESWLNLLEKNVVSIILSVSSEIILQERLFFSEELETRFKDKFLKELAKKLDTLMKLEDLVDRHTFAKNCAAWIEYRMICADRFLSETWINCNAASLLLSSWVLGLVDCDLPIYLNASDYFFNLPLNDPHGDIDDIDEQFKSKYVKRFNLREHFQPFHFPRKLRTDIWKPESFEESPWSYYRSVILDNMHILSKESSEEFEVRKDAAHYYTLIEVVNLVHQGVENLRQTQLVSKTIQEIIERIIAPIHSVKVAEVQRQINPFCEHISDSPSELYDFLAERIKHYQNYDIIDTLATIDFEVSIQHKYFQDGNTRIAQAIVLFVCAYLNMAAPEIVEGDQKQLFLSRWSAELNDDAAFQFWYKYYTTLFELPEIENLEESFVIERDSIRYEGQFIRLKRFDQIDLQYTFDNLSWTTFPLEPDYKGLFSDHVRIISMNLADLTQIPRFYVKLLTDSMAEKGHLKLFEKKSIFRDGWSVRWEDVIEKDATIYKEGMRPPHEINLLKKATGYDLKQLVVFKPKRIVLHKFIVYIVTHQQISSKYLVQLKKYFMNLEEIRKFVNDANIEFDRVRKEYEIYLDQCYFDDPLELKREPTLQKFVDKVRGVIRGRIANGKCQISPSQARRIMRMLVVDELLREYFEPKANNIVEKCFEQIKNTARSLTPLSELEFRENDFQRVSWVVVGGPAAGKSTLKRELKIQAPVCEINPDDYKLLLYSKGSKNASLVHEESSFIADQIMKALKTMPKRPDVLLDVVKSSEDKMDILAEGGATLHLTIATCEAEEAINRAYNRATKSENLEDLGRFVPTKEILLGHKKESLILPAVIRKYRINLILFDTSNPGKPILIARLETGQEQLKIYCLSLFLKFIRKALINEYATHKDQVYLYPFNGKAIYKELMRYIDEGVTLSFFKEEINYAVIDHVNGLRFMIDNWHERFLEEFKEGGFDDSILEDLLLYFVYPNYCNGHLIEIPEESIKVLDIFEVFCDLPVRNQANNYQLEGSESFRQLFPKLFESYPLLKRNEVTKAKNSQVPSSNDYLQPDEDFLCWLGKRVLTIHNIDQLVDLQSELQLFPTELDDSNLFALSHLWDSSRKNAAKKVITCFVHVQDDEDQIILYRWDAVIQEGCFEWIREIGKDHPEGVVWMDQVCLPQNNFSLINSHINFMGELFSEATTVICGYNCAEIGEDESSVKEYFKTYFQSAWTQQEYLFGKVILHPFILNKLSIKGTLDIIIKTFRSSEQFIDFFDGVVHRVRGHTWIPNVEQRRYDLLIENYADKDCVPLLEEIWKLGWNYSPSNSRELLNKSLKFRATCKWKGENMLNAQILELMLSVQCANPKDQLYGVFGVIYYHRTKQLLDYSDVEASYSNVLRMFQWPAMIMNRNHDNDSTGVDGCLTPLSWRDGITWTAYDEPKYSKGQLIARIKKEQFNRMRNKYSHVCLINEDILIWIFQRNDSDWIAFGTSKDFETKVGNIFLCVEKDLLLWQEERVHSDIIKILGFLLGKEENMMAPDDGPFICRWRFPLQMMEIKDYWLKAINESRFCEDNQDHWYL